MAASGVLGVAEGDTMNKYYIAVACLIGAWPGFLIGVAVGETSGNNAANNAAQATQEQRRLAIEAGAGGWHGLPDKEERVFRYYPYIKLMQHMQTQRMQRFGQ